MLAVVSLWKKKSVKVLTRALRRKSGRNAKGKLIFKGLGGGAKKRYRLVDFMPWRFSTIFYVLRVEKDPLRSCFLALVLFRIGEKKGLSYLLLPEGKKIGTFFDSRENVNVSLGSIVPLGQVALGLFVYNLEGRVKQGGIFGRASGAGLRVVRRFLGGFTLVRMASGEERFFSDQLFCIVGMPSNLANKNKIIGKAGKSRLLGRRPKVRGVAMNPVDHPHGGGEGKTSGGRCAVTPYGKLTKGVKTRKKKLMSNNYIFKYRWRLSGNIKN
jgi:large subunit ribosomal protein L2